jgi:hypothetical protein
METADFAIGLYPSRSRPRILIGVGCFTCGNGAFMSARKKAGRSGLRAFRMAHCTSRRTQLTIPKQSWGGRLCGPFTPVSSGFHRPRDGGHIVECGGKGKGPSPACHWAPHWSPRGPYRSAPSCRLRGHGQKRSGMGGVAYVRCSRTTSSTAASTSSAVSSEVSIMIASSAMAVGAVARVASRSSRASTSASTSS